VGNPRRLWRRYLILNPRYSSRVLAQRIGRKRIPAASDPSFIGWS
jgi:hypothetical protein